MKRALAQAQVRALLLPRMPHGHDGLAVVGTGFLEEATIVAFTHKTPRNCLISVLLRHLSAFCEARASRRPWSESRAYPECFTERRPSVKSPPTPGRRSPTLLLLDGVIAGQGAPKQQSPRAAFAARGLSRKTTSKDYISRQGSPWLSGSCC
jgi:hypothetical protein